jgi:diaminobutyrate-2-oxoglutarate transaminase
VEAALKLARRITGRANVIAFTGSYHGLSAGALAVTSGRYFRHPAYTQTANVVFMPFEGFLGEGVDTLGYMRRFFEDSSSGLDLPAAVVVEVIQAEGGVNIASAQWLQGLEQLCRKHDTLLIVDDIQVGNGRTGTFFSFEPFGLVPDIVVLSKAIGGLGLPLSINLIKPELDQWKPGEHSGTFRANNLAIVAATEALRYWETDDFATEVNKKGDAFESGLHQIQDRHSELKLQVRGRGLIYGLEIPDPQLAIEVAREAFKQGLVIELCGSQKTVLKCLPPLVIRESELKSGIDIIDRALQAVSQS